ncbi:hypothetical protein ACT7DL_07945 [Bacillus paranthracis]
MNQDYGRNIEGLTNSAISYLQSYEWPGNVRELEKYFGESYYLYEL